MLNNNAIKNVIPKLDDISKFFQFKKKKIKNEIMIILEEIDDEIVFLNKEIDELKLCKLNMEKIIDKNKTKIDNLTNQNIELEEEIDNIKRENDQIKHDLNETKIKLELVSKILAIEPDNNIGLNEFKKILYNDFFEFANKEKSLDAEAEVLLKLQAIEKELEVITTFPVIYKKNTISIGGGFSSGKSAFINNFFNNNKFKLPIGINPVTAIPTYVVSDNNNVIKGYSINGGSIDLAPNVYERLSHDFLKTFNFNLKKIMPFVTIGTPIKNLDKICFIDTPGYNPAITEGFTNEDNKVAAEFLEQSNSLIWMIGLDSNGTISASDLMFLTNLNLESKRLYLVANKADLKPQSELEDILNDIAMVLDDYGINYEGISAFSSSTGKEYLFIKSSIFAFLEKENNISIENRIRIIEKIRDVINIYKEALNQDIKEKKKIKSSLNSMELDLLEISYDKEDNGINNKIEKLKNYFDDKEIKKLLKKLNDVEKAFEKAINMIFDDMC